MEATIDISYSQIYNIILQLPVEYRLKLGKELTKNATNLELNRFLSIFKTEEIDEEDILSEVKSVRQKRYAERQSQKSNC